MTKKSNQKSGFKIGEYLIYPSHGVGKVIDIDIIKVNGVEFSTLIIFFDKEKTDYQNSCITN